MDSVISLIRDCFGNIRDIVSESEIRKLKITDEYAYRQYDEYLLTKNVRNGLAFSFFQFIIGMVTLITTIVFSDSAEQAAFLKIIGSVIIIFGSVLYVFYYLHELDGKKYDSTRYRIIFYASWNVYIIGGFFVSMGFLSQSASVSSFVLFAVFVFLVPVIRNYESLILTAIYIVPIIYYGISFKLSVFYYLSAVIALLGIFCMNAFKHAYYYNKWADKRKLKEAMERCESLSRRDSLTGMLNRTGLSVKFREKYQNSYGKHKMAVIMADIDNFRYYNHKFGYDRSDACLYNICNCIRIISKPVTKLVSRFGGDDFIIILEDMDEIEVVKFAEQIRSSVETMAIPFGDGGVITLSVGVSSITELSDEETYSKLINEADTQLIIAKRNGRNCVGYRNHAFKTEKKKETE